MFVKFCFVLARFVVERHLMVSEPSFKFRGSKAYIGFGFAGRRHLGLINNSFREAISFQGAFFLLSTVAYSFGLVLCRLCRVLRNSLVVSLYNLLYVRYGGSSGSLRTADVFPVVSPKNNVCDLELRNEFGDAISFLLYSTNEIE